MEADETPAPGQIRNANRAALTALLEREGCEPVYLGRTGDDAAETRWFELTPDEAGNARPALPEGERLAFDHAQIIADAARMML